MSDEAVHDKVKDFYGKRVKTTEDLIGDTCLVDKESFSADAKAAFKLIHPEVSAKNYGCGAVYPEAVEGCSVLDLGSGAGIDCFVLSQLVGPNGHVTGIDMTQEQLEVSRKYIDYHMQQFGYSKPNVEFREGYIEKLSEAGIKDETVDIIVSNCVINLSPDKPAVIREAYRVLKPGGEMYFSDIYSNETIPDALKNNKVLWGECISGALQWKELMQISTEAGFAPPILVNSRVITCNNSEVQNFLDSAGASDLKLCSATYRLVKPASKPPSEESLVEVQYKGTIKGYEKGVRYTCHGVIESGTPVTMPASTARLLQSSPRLGNHFTFTQPPAAVSSQQPFCPPLKEFVNIDPFEMASGSSEICVSKGGACCSGGGTPSDSNTTSCCASTASSKSCCS